MFLWAEAERLPLQEFCSVLLVLLPRCEATGNAPCAGASAPARHESCLRGRDGELTLRSHSRSSRWEAASRGRARQDVFCVVFAISSFPAAGQFRASPWSSATAPLLCRTCSGFPQWGPWGSAPSVPSGGTPPRSRQDVAEALGTEATQSCGVAARGVELCPAEPGLCLVPGHLRPLSRALGGRLGLSPSASPRCSS